MRAFCGAEERALWGAVVSRVLGGFAADVEETDVKEAVAIASEIGDAVLEEYRKRDGSKP